ncbi:MAG TPA: hormogonium polysaccharide biosynthesis glycosyltransferase HpsN [Leptolyngbya sp.]|nr:hormogonium polysaccharide biosynthesis glycosyltransferase HpsN [Leptolyngbya sp.]
MTQPFISVVIPTYGREEPLRDTLIDVLKQDYSHYEVLVVDQTPVHQPDTQEFLAELAQVGKIQWLKLDWASLPGARNYAVRRSNGEILLFIDDDVQLEPGYLAAHAKNYQRSDIGAVAGRVFDRMKLADFAPDLEIQDLPPEASDPGIAWYHLNLVHTVKPQQVLSARGCNMSYRREVFEQYNIWFDERFRGSAVREESDFCLRLRQTGLKIWYDPEASLVHLGEETGGCHDISTKSLKYQITFYHNHFLMGLNNLTFRQATRFFLRLFDCHVLGRPPCHKSGSPIKIVTRFGFYSLGFLSAIATLIRSLWNDGQTYTHRDRQVKA